MKRNPKITIVSPCYNHGKYIGDMLGSVFEQTFEDYEVIIVNDGSNDETVNILNHINHSKVKVINSSHKGPSCARNIGIEEAQTDIIVNLDADDKIAPTFLAKMYNVFLSQANLGIVTTETQFFGAKSGIFYLEPYSLAKMLKTNLILSTALLRKSDWEKVGGYSDNFIYGLEDYDFWLSIIALGREVYRIPEPLIFYRKYQNPKDCRSERRKKSRKKSIMATLTLFHRHQKLYERCPEAMANMILLKQKWEKENFVIREFKELYHGIRYRSQL
ncbi:MAG: glycosyltransferase family 2 protein [Desulfobacterales bacterium]|nr:glycosyltransferase family 2 protein [Desulfobacterales bacterium]